MKNSTDKQISGVGISETPVTPIIRFDPNPGKRIPLFDNLRGLAIIIAIIVHTEAMSGYSMSFFGDSEILSGIFHGGDGGRTMFIFITSALYTAIFRSQLEKIGEKRAYSFMFWEGTRFFTFSIIYLMLSYLVTGGNISVPLVFNNVFTLYGVVAIVSIPFLAFPWQAKLGTALTMFAIAFGLMRITIAGSSSGTAYYIFRILGFCACYVGFSGVFEAEKENKNFGFLILISALVLLSTIYIAGLITKTRAVADLLSFSDREMQIYAPFVFALFMYVLFKNVSFLRDKNLPILALIGRKSLYFFLIADVALSAYIRSVAPHIENGRLLPQAVFGIFMAAVLLVALIIDLITLVLKRRRKLRRKIN